jgi:hypothetical protein
LKNIIARLQKEYPEEIKIHQDMALVRRGLPNKIIALAEKKFKPPYTIKANLPTATTRRSKSLSPGASNLLLIAWR